ncbi:MULTISPECIES: pyridoxal phosphate-dependent aminotransferase [unclassified Prochlorococcus]|uniref:pyridoxal phosphate-dependent aminotransferase n=1 Tax=unclassified Prochlorococcus TaxID=2627481 RepID=UPI0005338E9A|nr:MULTISPECIES: pyridoxal phosphate-dependent aminotransferase [unclassified Prochlorococcus]KGG15343.1 Aspartate aminotransferase [Prochlorococcus sp. MIT 0602]KGG17621.1 Aspartate aminotransferase [Prochlorococcus sp. MIT 0603]
MNTNNSISKRAIGLKPSLTLEISALAQKLKLEGRDICSLSAGEPDFDTPNFIIEACKKALDEGITRYGPAAGDLELRKALAKKLTESYEFNIGSENLLITNGGKQAIFNVLQIILDEGDEVLIPSPFWLSYPEITRFAGGIPISIKTSPEEGFKLHINNVEEKITSKTKVLILNSPCNPTGRVMKLDELQDIANLLRKYPNIFVISDEIYEYLIAEDQIHIHLSRIAPDLKERIFTVNGFAKAWAMTGWRVGYLQGNSQIINKAIALQSQSTSNVCSFAQKGALAAITEMPNGIEHMIDSFNSRREILTNGINQISGLSICPQHGAFYAFPLLDAHLPNSLDFCKTALEEEGLALIPGIAFGDDRCIRISCSASSAIITDGLTRLNSVVKRLS